MRETIALFVIHFEIVCYPSLTTAFTLDLPRLFRLFQLVSNLGLFNSRISDKRVFLSKSPISFIDCAYDVDGYLFICLFHFFGTFHSVAYSYMITFFPRAICTTFIQFELNITSTQGVIKTLFCSDDST